MTQDVIDAPPAGMAQQAQAGALAQAQPTGALMGAAEQRPLTAVEHAIRSGASAAELREILALQRDMDNHRLELMREQRRMADEDRKLAAELAFRRDFAAFTGEGIVVPKSKYVDRGRAGSFWQAEFGRISTMLKPALARHGFGIRYNEVFGWRRVTTDGQENDIPWVYVTCYLEHRDGHAERLDLEGPPGDMSANTPTQNMQVTGSYLKRQATLAITGTATQDEDDEGAMRPRRRQQQDDDQQQGPDDALLDAGRAEAMKGMKALTAWWGALNAKQRSDMNDEFGALRKCATKVDQEAGR